MDFVRSFLVSLSGLLLTFAPGHVWARPAPQNEITVTLFGQPCLLNGPLDQATLKEIHAISPEQLYPSEEVKKDQLVHALDKLRSSTGLPAALDRYRERSAKRLEAQIAFFEGWTAAQKAGKPEPLVAATKKYLLPKRRKEFLAAAKKADFAKKSDSLFETFGETIEPDPEEEFHRAIQKLNVRYTCVFEEPTSNEEAGNE